MIAPPGYIIEAARLAAIDSPCAKSKRGVVAFNPERHDEIENARGIDNVSAADLNRFVIAGRGFNGPPRGFSCGDSEACRRDCAKLCLHAEQRAIWAAGALDDVDDLELVHVKVVYGQVVPGGGPSCWQCSRLVVEVGLRGVWLFVEDLTIAYPFGTQPGRWRFYSAVEFHRETLRACGIGGVP